MSRQPMSPAVSLVILLSTALNFPLQAQQSQSSSLSWHPEISFAMGKGVNKNIPTDTATDICVDIKPVPASNENSSTVSTMTSISLVTNAKELHSALGLSASLAAKVEFLKLGAHGTASAKYDFSKDITENSLALVVAIGVNYGNYRIVPNGNDQAPLKLKPYYQELLDNGQGKEFRSKCGSHFVQEVRRESLYVAMVKIKNLSVSEKRELTAALNVGKGDETIATPVSQGSTGVSKKFKYSAIKDASIGIGVNNFFKKASSLKASTEVLFVTRGGNLAHQNPIFTDVGQSGEVITLNGILHALSEYVKHSTQQEAADHSPIDSLTTNPQLPSEQIFRTASNGGSGKLPGTPAEYILSNYEGFDRQGHLSQVFETNDAVRAASSVTTLGAKAKKEALDRILDQIEAKRQDIEDGDGQKNSYEVAKVKKLREHQVALNNYLASINKMGIQLAQQKITLALSNVPAAPVVPNSDLSVNLIIDQGRGQLICQILPPPASSQNASAKKVRCGDYPAASWSRDEQPAWKSYFKVTGTISLALLTNYIKISYLNGSGQWVEVKRLQYADSDEQNSYFQRDGKFEIYFWRMTQFEGIKAYRAMLENPASVKIKIAVVDLFGKEYVSDFSYNHVGDHLAVKKGR